MLQNCIFCDKQFTLKANLKVHVETVHEGIKIKCDKCDYKTGQKVSLRRHQQSMHGGMRIKCSFCEKEYKWEVDLRRHTRSYHTSQQFQCEKVFKERRNLSSHRKVFHEKIVKHCDFPDCVFQASYTNRYAMNHHKLTVHGIGKKPTVYKCNICTYRTRRGCDIKRHTNEQHLKLSQYQCYICDFKTTRRHLIKKHTISKHKQKGPGA